MTNKERLIKHLKFWAASGFRLKPDATHMTAYGKPIYTDMKKIEGGDLKCWSMRDSAWFVQVPSRITQWCLPLSLLTDDELAEFIEPPAQEHKMSVMTDKEKLLAFRTIYCNRSRAFTLVRSRD